MPSLVVLLKFEDVIHVVSLVIYISPTSKHIESVVPGLTCAMVLSRQEDITLLRVLTKNLKLLCLLNSSNDVHLVVSAHSSNEHLENCIYLRIAQIINHVMVKCLISF